MRIYPIEEIINSLVSLLSDSIVYNNMQFRLKWIFAFEMSVLISPFFPPFASYPSTLPLPAYNVARRLFLTWETDYIYPLPSASPPLSSLLSPSSRRLYWRLPVRWETHKASHRATAHLRVSGSSALKNLINLRTNAHTRTNTGSHGSEKPIQEHTKRCQTQGSFFHFFWGQETGQVHQGTSIALMKVDQNTAEEIAFVSACEPVVSLCGA